MEDFSHGHIQWQSLESTCEDQTYIFLIQDSVLSQHVLEPTKGKNVVLSSQNELVDNVKIHEPLGISDHNQIHLDIKNIQEKLPQR